MHQLVNIYSGFNIRVLVLFASLALSSCASVDENADPLVALEEAADVQTSGKQKFAAWNPEKFPMRTGGSQRAVKALLKQADVFILYHSLEQASDKLERLLRIDPKYSAAWSRLSWIALQEDYPDRAKQMAQRSNSHARDNKKLKILNWTFIRQASQKMNDAGGVIRAERMIEELGEF
jgi:Tfp pilus assembly protein PilF